VQRAALNKPSSLGRPPVTKLADPEAPSIYNKPWSQGEIGEGIATLSPDNILDMHHSIATAAKPPMGQATQESLMAGQLKNKFSSWVDSVLKNHEDLRSNYHSYKQMQEAREAARSLGAFGGSDHHKSMEFYRKAFADAEAAAQREVRAANAYEQLLERYRNGQVKPNKDGKLPNPTSSKQATEVRKASIVAENKDNVVKMFRHEWGEALKAELAKTGEEGLPEQVNKLLANRKRVMEIMGPREGRAFLDEIRVIEGRLAGKQLGLSKGGDDNKSMQVFNRLTRQNNLDGVQAFREAWGQSIKSAIGDLTEGRQAQVLDALLTPNGQKRVMDILGPEQGAKYIDALMNKRLQSDLGGKLYGNSDTAYKTNRMKASGAMNDMLTGLLHFRPMTMWQAGRDMLSHAYQQKRADQVNKLLSRQGPEKVGEVLDTVLAKQAAAQRGHTLNVGPVTLRPALNATGPFVASVPGQASPFLAPPPRRDRERP